MLDNYLLIELSTDSGSETQQLLVHSDGHNMLRRTLAELPLPTKTQWRSGSIQDAEHWIRDYLYLAANCRPEAMHTSRIFPVTVEDAPRGEIFKPVRTAADNRIPMQYVLRRLSAFLSGSIEPEDAPEAPKTRRYCVGGCGNSEMLRPDQDGLVCKDCAEKSKRVRRADDSKEYEVTVDTMDEQYVYTVRAKDKKTAKARGKDHAVIDGMSPYGVHWIKARRMDK